MQRGTGYKFIIDSLGGKGLNDQFRTGRQRVNIYARGERVINLSLIFWEEKG